jgi:dephospho-CoA kinase
MIRVGLTGGIGSGKSTVAGYFRQLGVPVYDSDLRARELMEGDPGLRKGIRELLGPQAYRNGALNRPFIADRVFGDRELLGRLNALVHPAVRADFLRWAARQSFPYVVQEAAVLFENGAYRDFDRMILVTAPAEERIQRVMARDAVSAGQVRSRMENQWDAARKIPLADFVIENTDLEETRRQVGQIHLKIMQLSGG